MTDRLQAVAKARCNAMHFDRIDYAPCSDCLAYVRAKFAMSVADAAWREKQGTPPELGVQKLADMLHYHFYDMRPKTCSSETHCRETAEDLIRSFSGILSYVPAQPPSAPGGDVKRVMKAVVDVIFRPNGYQRADLRAAIASALSPAPQQARSEDEELGRLLRENGMTIEQMPDDGRWRAWVDGEWSMLWLTPLEAVQSALAANEIKPMFNGGGQTQITNEDGSTVIIDDFIPKEPMS